MTSSSLSDPLHVMQRRVRGEQGALRNHLLSILQDAEQVELLRSLMPGTPVVANLRNGLWYAAHFDGTCYFKSTDGHDCKWSFSLSRMNLDLARVAASNSCEGRGAVVVDSTRRGKLFPDSFTATVPIWCSVLNRLVFDEDDDAGAFHAPPWMANTAISQIEAQIPQLVNSVGDMTRAIVRDMLRPLLIGAGPLQPVWVCVSEDGTLDWSGARAEQFVGDGFCGVRWTPIVLFSCSPVTIDGAHSQHHSWHHIQGAGDDEESWARGLTPAMFWAHKDDILASDYQGDVDEAVERIVAEGNTPALHPYQPLPCSVFALGKSGLYVGRGSWGALLDAAANPIHVSGIIEFLPCNGSPSAAEDADATDAAVVQLASEHCAADGRRVAVLQLKVGSDKREASSQPKQVWSQTVIPAILIFYESLRPPVPSADNTSILIAHHDDTILPCAAALAVLLAHFHPTLDMSARRNGAEARGWSKGDIRGYVAAMQVHVPDASRIPRRLMKELMAYFLAANSATEDWH